MQNPKSKRQESKQAKKLYDEAINTDLKKYHDTIENEVKAAKKKLTENEFQRQKWEATKIRTENQRSVVYANPEFINKWENDLLLINDKLKEVTENVKKTKNILEQTQKKSLQIEADLAEESKNPKLIKKRDRLLKEIENAERKESAAREAHYQKMKRIRNGDFIMFWE